MIWLSPPIEIVILDYTSHQRRLFIPLATTYALQFGLNYTKQRYITAKDEKDKRDIFLLASGNLEDLYISILLVFR